jgi:hypothetical protein
VDVSFIANRGEQHQLARLEARSDEPGRGRRHLCIPPNTYNDEYTYVAISGLLDIDTNTMIPRLRLLQFIDEHARPHAGWVTPDGASVGKVGDFASTYALAQAALASGKSLDSFVELHKQAASRPYAELLAEGRVLPPLMHPDVSRCLVSGTGLTHYGSASARDAMHKKLAANADSLSDSMQMLSGAWTVAVPRMDSPARSPSGSTRATARSSWAVERRCPRRLSRSTAAKSPRSSATT